MAGRIRSIKPEVLEDETAGQLTDAAWRLWVSSWLLADDHGNFRANVNQLAGQVFWGSRRTVDVGALLQELQASGLITTYTVNGQPFANLKGWTKHQRIDNAGKPRCPGPELRDSPRTSANLGDLPLDPDLRSPTTDHRKGPPSPPRAAEEISAAEPPRPQPSSALKPRRRSGLAGASPEEAAAVTAVLERLSDRSGRQYKPEVEGHAMPVLLALRRGFSEDDLRTVVWERAAKWGGDPKMDEFLRPSTLFGKQKLPEYLAHARAEWDASERDVEPRQVGPPPPSRLLVGLLGGKREGG